MNYKKNTSIQYAETDTVKPICEDSSELVHFFDISEKASDTISGPVAAKEFSRQFILSISSSLTLNEVGIILTAERIREEGLVLARSKQLKEAKEKLEDANLIATTTEMSLQAKLAVSTFQYAAESYLAYMHQKIDDATLLMVKSIDDCRLLSEDYGQNMEFRKIHLGRNLARLACFDNDVVNSLKCNIRMLEYLGGNHASWPFSQCLPWIKFQSLSIDEYKCSVEEMLTNIPMVIKFAKNKSIKSQCLKDEVMLLNKKNGGAVLQTWCMAVISALFEEDSYQNHTKEFLVNSNGQFPIARNTLKEILLDKGFLPCP